MFTTADHIPSLLKLSAKIPVLKVIVSFDTLDNEVRSVLSSWAESLGIRIMHLSEGTCNLFLYGGSLLTGVAVERYGEEHLSEPLPATPDQIATLCYTSVR